MSTFIMVLKDLLCIFSFSSRISKIIGNNKRLRRVWF